jgi:hypothetical protein
MNSGIYKSFVLIWSLLIIWTCASERAITGGPEDREPPQIIFSTPENESIGVDTKTEIYIKFSEQMKQTTVKSALQLWPRPPGGYEINTSWTWIKVVFDQALDSSETYLLTLDKTAEDLKGNKLASTYILAFSTGDSLNSGRLTGSINGGLDIKKNGDLFLYRTYDVNLDQLRSQPADYIFQTDNEGNFELPYLAEQSYTLFYHWDRNRNKKIDGDDFFGRPTKASVFARSDSLRVDHRIWPQSLPVSQVRLLDLSDIGEQFLQIRTGRPVTNETVENFELVSDGDTLAFLGATTVSEDNYAIHVNTAASMIDSSLIWIRNFADTSKYILHSDTLQYLKMTGLDTLVLEPLAVAWKNGKREKLPSDLSSIYIKANLPFSFTADTAFQLVDSEEDSVRIPGKLNEVSSMLWEFIPDDTLDDGKFFKWQVNTDLLQAPLNGFPMDSVMTGKLFSVNADSLGSVRLMHMGTEPLNCILVSKGVKREFKLRPTIPYLITDLVPQEYFLSAYIDKNGDSRYSSGGLEPADKAESFWVYPSEIKVRARWETDLGLWRLGEN